MFSVLRHAVTSSISRKYVEYLSGKVSRFEQTKDIGIVDNIPDNPAGKGVTS